MYQEMLSEGAYNNWNEYCALNELARQEYEDEQAKEEQLREMQLEEETAKNCPYCNSGYCENTNTNCNYQYRDERFEEDEENEVVLCGCYSE